MKKILFIVFAMMLLLAPLAKADQITLNRVSGYYSGSGGEFSVDIKNDGMMPDLNWVLTKYDSKTKNIQGGPYPDFQSFCVERWEGITGGPFDVVFNDSAIYGGVGGADPISVGTAWLYYQFARGTLPGYDYTPGAGRVESAGLLQNVIWYFEGEVATIDPSNLFYVAAITKFGDLAAAKADNFSGGVRQYPVQALNLWKAGHVGEPGYEKQDMLVLVPEPGTLLLLGAGILGLGLVIRKRRK